MDLMRTARFLYLKARSKAKFSTVGLRWIGRTLSMHLFISSIIILRPLSWGFKRCFYLTSDVCLSCTFTLSREHRGLGRLKLAQKYPTSHVTRTSLSGSKGQSQCHQASSVSSTGRPTWTYSNFGISICVHDVYRVSTCRPEWRHIIAAARIQNVLKVVITGWRWVTSVFHIKAATFFNIEYVRNDTSNTSSIHIILLPEQIPASVFRLDALALSVIATATWLSCWVAGWVSVTAGIVSKRLNLSQKLFRPSGKPII